MQLEVVDESPLIEEGGARVESSCVVANVSYTVQVGKRLLRPSVRKQVLYDVSANFDAGSLTAIMGPSGSGKTSLLELIGKFNRSRGGVMEGQIRLNESAGVVLVPQDEVLLAGLTARELLNYAAELRGVSSKRVEEVLQLLGLTECADTQVGSPEKRGISGGQRKRVSISLELLTNPAYLLLDEPTSGLDSKTALDAMRILNALATKEGKTIITTLHQPSIRMYRLLNAFVLMVKGRVAYCGRNPEDYFHDFIVRDNDDSNINPAEQFLEWLQADDVDSLIDTWSQHVVDKKIQFLAAYDDDDFDGSILSRARSLSNTAANRFSLYCWWCSAGTVSAPGSLYQRLRLNAFHTNVLARREFLDRLKDPEKFMQSLTVKFAVGLIIGLVWIGQASHTNDGIFPVRGALFVVCINSVMDATFTTSMSVPTSRTLLIRELSNGYYGLTARHIAVTFVDWTLAATCSLVLSLPVYFLVGLRQEPIRFVRFVATSCCLAFSGVSFGHIVGTISDNFKEVQGYVSPSLTPLILFSGYLIPKDQIPYSFKWLYDISFFSYALRIFEINQFRGWSFHDCKQIKVPTDDDVIRRYYNATGVDLSDVSITSCYSNGGEFLRSAGVNPNNLNRDFGILIFYFFALAFVSYLAYVRAIAR